MLTPYRQKYNPKKPKTKIKQLGIAVQVFFKKNFSKEKKIKKTFPGAGYHRLLHKKKRLARKT